MRTYAEYRPTQFDCKGLALPDKQDWLVAPVIQTRGSGCLEQSNFATALRLLGGESETVEVHRFGHWGPGWFEIIIVNPSDVERVKILESMESTLSDYPVLDETDLSNREYESYGQSWEQGAVRDFIADLARVHGLTTDTKFRMYDIDSDKYSEFLESLIPSGDYYDSEDCWPRTEYAAQHCTRKQLAAFLSANRQPR